MRKNLTRRARAYHVVDVLALVFLVVTSVVMVASSVVAILMDAGISETDLWLWSTSLLALLVFLAAGSGTLSLELSQALFRKVGVSPCPKCGGSDPDGSFNELKCLDCGFSTWFHDNKNPYTWWELSAGECPAKK